MGFCLSVRPSISLFLSKAHFSSKSIHSLSTHTHIHLFFQRSFLVLCLFSKDVTTTLTLFLLSARIFILYFEGLKIQSQSYFLYLSLIRVSNNRITRTNLTSSIKIKRKESVYFIRFSLDFSESFAPINGTTF